MAGVALAAALLSHILWGISGRLSSAQAIQPGRGRLLKQVKRLFTLWHKLRDGDLDREGFQQAMKPVEHRVKKLLEAGSQAEHERDSPHLREYSEDGASAVDICTSRRSGADQQCR